jgi:anti-sigma factor RsiW
MSTRNDLPDEETLVARDATYYKAPENLRTRIRAHLAEQARERERPAFWRWMGVGAGFAFAAALTWNALLLTAQTSPEERIAGEVMSAHVRSLLAASHLNDVVSTDQHTVKPWFQGRLDFAPVVTDLAGAGFALDGGRLDYLDGRPVAAITYRHRLHVVNLFEWPARGAPDAKPVLEARNGYALVHWTQGGLAYWAVSDAAGADILQFAHLFIGS